MMISEDSAPGIAAHYAARLESFFSGWPLRVESSPQSGRYLVAAEDIEADQVILRSSMFTAAIMSSHKKRICSACMAVATQRHHYLKCKECSQAFWCSPECWDIHHGENKHSPISGDGVSDVPPRTVPHQMVCPVLRALGSCKFDVDQEAILVMLAVALARQCIREGELPGHHEAMMTNEGCSAGSGNVSSADITPVIPVNLDDFLQLEGHVQQLLADKKDKQQWNKGARILMEYLKGLPCGDEVISRLELTPAKLVEWVSMVLCNNFALNYDKAARIVIKPATSGNVCGVNDVSTPTTSSDAYQQVEEAGPCQTLEVIQEGDEVVLPEADAECGNPDEPYQGPATPNCTADLAIEGLGFVDKDSTINDTGPSEDSKSSSISSDLQCCQDASAAESAVDDGESGMAEAAHALAKEGGQGSSAEVPGRALASGGSIVGGRAVFISASYFNHSCRPNCAVLTRLGAAEIRATQHIRAGDEVTLSYIDTDMPRSERQKTLKRNFSFVCSCPRCKEDASKGSEKYTYFRSAPSAFHSSKPKPRGRKARISR